MKNFKNLPISQFMQLIGSTELIEMLGVIMVEVDRAETKHPKFCDNIADALIVINEELGEASQAYINAKYAKEDVELVRKELVETAATIFRALLNFEELNSVKPIPGKTHIQKCMDSYEKFIKSGVPNKSFSQWYGLFLNNSALRSDIPGNQDAILTRGTIDELDTKYKTSSGAWCNDFVEQWLKELKAPGIVFSVWDTSKVAPFPGARATGDGRINKAVKGLLNGERVQIISDDLRSVLMNLNALSELKLSVRAKGTMLTVKLK